jgi:SAM-dependent methyltransferase
VRATVVWHDLECGGYTADLPLWRELAEREAGPILDLGAGTGRVARNLSAGGNEVVALDLDPVLLSALSERDPGVSTVVADARSFDLDRRFGLILAPMQTVQLLGGAGGRAAFLGAVRRHLIPGGLLAAALTGRLEPFDPAYPLPPADVAEVAGRTWRSQPIALRVRQGRVALERVREVDGTSETDVVHLDVLDAGTLEREAIRAGFAAERRRAIAPTDEHVGSIVVCLRATGRPAS